ncbi:MAG: cytochrome c-type biogenesis protein CcmH [Acidimicrobiales bacterium]
MTRQRRLLAWVGLAAAAVGLLVVAAVDQGGIESDAEQIQRLSESYACPVCDGESVADSNAAVAASIRQFISDEVTAGTSEVQIRNQLIEAYGVEVLLNPPAEGITALVWVLPVMFVVLGAVGVAGAITRNNRGSDRDPSDEDHELLARARQDRR